MERRAGDGQLLPTLTSLACCFVFLVTLVNARELNDILWEERSTIERVFGLKSREKPIDVLPAAPSEDSQLAEEPIATLQRSQPPEPVNITINLSVPNQNSHLASYTILSETWDLLAGERFKYSTTPIPATLYVGEKLTVSVGDSYGNIAHCRLPDEERLDWQHYLEVGDDLEEGDEVNVVSFDANFSTDNPKSLRCTYQITFGGKINQLDPGDS